MMRRVGYFLIILVLGSGFFQQGLAASQRSAIQIGIVYDGPAPPHGWGKILRSKLFQREILALTRGDLNVQFPPNKQLRGDWTLSGVKKAVDALLADPTVDLILALGLLASQDVATRAKLPKPVVAPFIIDEKLQGLPYRKGRSGVRNLNYLSYPSRFTRDLKAFRELVPFTRLTILVDEMVLQSIRELENKARTEANQKGITVTLVPVGTTIGSTLTALPDDAEAVFVTPLIRLPSKEFDRLVSGLIERRLPSFSMFGKSEVEQGLFATISPDTDAVRLARRVALNVHRILLGENAGTLPVPFSEREQLVINMATARAIDVWPSFQVLTEAELLHEEPEKTARRLSLYTVMKESLSVNLDLASADRRVAAGLGDVNNARAQLLPQVGFNAAGLNLNLEQTKPAYIAVASGSLKQVIYSDKAWSNYTVQQKTQESRVAQRRELQLDIAQQGGVAYLNVLRAKTIQRIRKANLKLTHSNLELARVREAVGQAARDEVFRWESEIANGRISVLDAQALTQQSKISLNRLLHRPLEEPFTTQETGLDDPLLFFENNRLITYIDNPRNFRIFREFEVQEGLRMAPELHQYDARIEAQARTVLNSKRAYWAPEVALDGLVIQRLAQNEVDFGAGDAAGIALGPAGAGFLSGTTFGLQLGLSIPLYAGGSKDATNLKAQEELRRLKLEREATVGQLEERIRSAMVQAGASFPSIKLSQQAAEAARKNLELVVDQYSRGAVDIIKLLNSQNAALQANENAANAVYVFLIDLINIQRAAGQFDYFKSQKEREAWFQRLVRFFEKLGVPPAHQTPPGSLTIQ